MQNTNLREPGVTPPLCCEQHPRPGWLFKTALAHLNLKNYPGYRAQYEPEVKAPILLLQGKKRCGSAKVRGASAGLDASAEAGGEGEDWCDAGEQTSRHHPQLALPSS